MDLIVYTPGGSIQSISGVNEATTCAQIIYALAHAIQQKGRFALLARLGGPTSQEHRFTSNERPFEFVQECAKQKIRPEFELRKLGEEDDFREILSEEFDSVNRLSTNSSSSTVLSEVKCVEQRNASTCQQNKNRPPPPDYNMIITERCNSLRKDRDSSQTKTFQSPLTFLNIQNFSLQDLCTRKFSRMDLEGLIDIQEKILDAQKAELIRVELTLLDSKERELVQLQKQHINLQTVLNSLRNGNWISKIKVEKAEAERLNTAITAMRTAVAEKEKELQEAMNLKATLEKQLINEVNRVGGKENNGL